MGFFTWLIITNAIISFLIPIVIILISVLINKTYFRMDVSECGFDSFNVRVFPVSLRFFIFCAIFLILDLELVLIFPCPLMITLNLLIFNLSLLTVLIFIGLVAE